MIFLSTPLFDTAGFVRIHELPSTDRGVIRRRMNRIATLDGGAVINDSGYTEADRTIRLRWRPGSRAAYDQVNQMVQLYPLLTVAMREGVFEAAPESLRGGSGEAELVLRVKGVK